MTQTLVLASASSTRLDLLRMIGLSDVRVHPSCVEEVVHPRETPRAYALRVATEKAQKVAVEYPQEYVLGADTVVAVGRRILRKASTAIEARHQMDLLSGRRHWVYTGVCLICPGGISRQRLGQTHVALKRLSTQEKDAFIHSGEWRGVCCYRLKGMISCFVKQLVGAHTTVMGLPLYEVSQMLQGNGFRLLA